MSFIKSFNEFYAFLFALLAALVASGYSFSKTRKNKKKEKNDKNKTEEVLKIRHIDPNPNDLHDIPYPEDLLLSYRTCIANCTVFMEILDILFEKELVEKNELEAYILNKIMKSSNIDGFREYFWRISLTLFNSDFITIDGSPISYRLTYLGKTTVPKLHHYKQSPPATQEEIQGYLKLIKGTRVLYTMLIYIDINSIVEEKALYANIVEKTKGETTPSLNAVVSILRILSTSNWILSHKQKYEVSDLGKRVVEQLQLVR